MIELKTQTRVRFTLSLSLSLSGLFHSLSLFQIFHFSVRKRKKSNQKSAGFFPESHTILHLFVSHVILRGIILSLRVYYKERVGEKGEDKRV